MPRPLFVLFAALSSCGGAADDPTAGLPATPGAAMEATPSTPAATHRLLGILDPERDSMVAFALKVPLGWEASQSFTRKWDGAVSAPQITLKLRSPDGSSQIEYRPSVGHVWAEGPMTAQLRQQKQQFGMDPRMFPNELQPMSASAYARRVVVPQLAREGFVLGALRNDQDAPEESVSALQLERRGSVDGTLPDGRQVRVECRMRLDLQQTNGETYTSWSVVPSITQSSTDLEAAYANTRIAQDSIVSNPAWQQLEQDAANRGMQVNSEASARQHQATMDSISRNTEAMTAAHNARMGDIQRQGEANTARYNERMAEMDRTHAAYQEQSAAGDRQQRIAIDTIRGESAYVDPNTGERVKVEDGYNNVYRANSGTDLGNTTILATQAPLDPQQVDWQELQRVSLQDY